MKRVFLPLFMLLCGVLSADSPKVFFRLKLEQVMPEGHPVRAAVSVFYIALYAPHAAALF